MNEDKKIIPDVCICESFVMQLREDGGITVSGTDKFTRETARQWDGVVKICSGRDHALGLRRDGKVVSFGDNSCGQCDVTPWASVREIYAGENISAAVDADGNMLIAGSHSKTLVNDGSGSLVSSLLPSAHFLTTQQENEKIKDDYDYCFENNHITITGYRGNLCNVSMPDEIDKTRIEKIGERAFKDNDFITNISLPYHLIEIGDSAFWGCTELRTVSHYDSDLERIGENAFWNCTSLISFETMGFDLVIDKNAFRGCSSLSHVRLMDGVKEIRSNAFSRCTSLKHITIPKTVTHIANNAFNKCYQLTITGAKGSYAESYAMENGIPFEEEDELTANAAAPAKVNVCDIKALDTDSIIEMNKACTDDIKGCFSGVKVLSGRIELSELRMNMIEDGARLNNRVLHRNVWCIYHVELEISLPEDKQIPLDYYTAYRFSGITENDGGTLTVDVSNMSVCENANIVNGIYYNGFHSCDSLISRLTVQSDDNYIVTGSIAVRDSINPDGNIAHGFINFSDLFANLAASVIFKLLSTVFNSMIDKLIELSEDTDIPDADDTEGDTENDTDADTAASSGSGVTAKGASGSDQIISYYALRSKLSRVDDHVINMKCVLRQKGISGNELEWITEEQRYIWEAAAVNAFLEHTRMTLKEPDYAKILSDWKNGKYKGLGRYSNPPAALEATQQKFEYRELFGKQRLIYNDPETSNKKLIRIQGESVFPLRGTCGICQSANLATFGGIGQITEPRAISAALHCSQKVFDSINLSSPNRNERGGTTTENRAEILDYLGCPNKIVPVKYDKASTLRLFAEIIRQGRIPIVTVDVRRLWRNGQSGAHAISLISVSEDGNEFVYNDTGMGIMGIVSGELLSRCMYMCALNVTANIVR